MNYVQQLQKWANREKADYAEYCRLAHTELHQLAAALNSMPEAVKRSPDFKSELVWIAICLFTDDPCEQELAEHWVLEYLRNV